MSEGDVGKLSGFLSSERVRVTFSKARAHNMIKVYISSLYVESRQKNRRLMDELSDRNYHSAKDNASFTQHSVLKELARFILLSLKVSKIKKKKTFRNQTQCK